MTTASSPAENANFAGVSQVQAVGLMTGLALMFVGLLVQGLFHNQSPLHMQPIPLNHLIDHWGVLDPAAIIETGLLLLLATPPLALLAALSRFVRQRDIVFVGVTILLLVLVIVGALLSNR